jgi:hypothetical protein
MPSGIAVPELARATQSFWPGMLRRLWVRLRANKLDRALAAGASPGENPDLSLRAGQLVSDEQREQIATTIDALLDLADESRPIYLGRNRVPVERERIRTNRARFERLATALRRTEDVSPRAVAMARQLVTDFRGPVYASGLESRLPDALVNTLRALES